MIRRTVFLLGFLALTAAMYAETQFQTASATVTAQYVVLPYASQSVLVCNDSASANVAYFRLFEDRDVVGVATATSSPLAIGACKSFAEPGGRRFVSLSVLSAGTSTINIDSK